jgi:hypothetical protein
MNILVEEGLWEDDFILNCILPKANVYYKKTNEIENTILSADVFVFSSRVHSVWNIRDVVKRIKPKIIIMLSDEFHEENNWNYNLLGNYCDLFLRQYHHSYYNYTPNTIHLPLGYTNGCKSFLSEKKYEWSFIGEIKTDRQEMIEIYSQSSNHFIGNDVDKEKMCEIYSQSKFVPCGRGNSSLDCFRLYEASMNGAIPVVVGSKKEIETTFKYEENPPWIFAESWEDAYDLCKTTTIDSMQVLKWWNQRIEIIQNKVKEVL